MTRFFTLPAFCIFAMFLIPSTSFALETSPDRFQMNHDIHIQPDEKVGDVTCIGCSVYVRGQVSGDVTTIAGSVIAESGASIAEDVTTIGGNTRMESGTQVAGDLTAIGGDLRRDPQAAVAGDVTTIGGHGWVFLIFLLPVAILGVIIALIIWLIRRSRRPIPIPAYSLRRN